MEERNSLNIAYSLKGSLDSHDGPVYKVAFNSKPKYRKIFSDAILGREEILYSTTRFY